MKLPSHPATSITTSTILFYCEAFVFSHMASPLADTFLMNDIHPPKVRSVGMPMTKFSSQRLLSHALILDSSANIHILNNPNFLSCITSCLDQYNNTRGSRTLCKQWGGSAEHSNLFLFLPLDISINPTALEISLAYLYYLILIGL